MNENPWHPPFRPGTLWETILGATRRGRERGALRPIPTRFEQVVDNGIPFVVRVVDNLRRKEEARREQESAKAAGDPANPFLPCDPDLYVDDVSDSHVAVLNKFNVLDHHLLVVTRGFEDQETLLTVADFHALWRCMREVDGLAFYNGGVVAGASQKHKHLQIAPYPITEGIDGLPIDDVVHASLGPGIGRVSSFGFDHALSPCSPGWLDDAHRAACESHERYVELLSASGIAPSPGDLRQPAPYNLLVTREWMLLVPRSQEFFETMSINAIGYAGGLLVRDEAQLERVREVGPLRIVSACGVARTGT